MKPRHLQVLRIAVSAVLLGLAWHLVDHEMLLGVLRTMDVMLLCTAISLTVPMHLLSALRWKLTCAQIDTPLSLHEAVREYYLASWLNTVLPGGMTGDAMRVWRQGAPGRAPQTHPDRSPAGFLSRFRQPLHGVVLERFAGQCALFAVLGAGMALNHSRLMPLFDVLLTITGLIALVIVVWWALVSHARTGDGSVHGWRQQLLELHTDARRAFSPWRVFWLQLALSLTVVATYLTIFWLSAQAVHAPLDFATAWLAIPLVLTAMTLPISVGGLGLRETAAAVLWPGLSMSASSGVASALAYGVVILIGALPGAIVLMHRRSASTPQ
ncbi:MAG: uncharacterized membrane protein YbhN (UPF0104 family) [Gammaproteobacteria bacterium]|jgi:uncharacterized membrane protein YbhN (UPF0104 family)